jgi:Zn-dependent peptidase ImmA (M78 family)
MVVKFRRAASKNVKMENEAMAAWLKIGENKAKEIATMPFNRTRFEAALKQIKPLTCKPPEIFEPEMVRLCAEAGVAVVFVKELPGTHVSGAAYWMSKEKVILMLSLRYKWEDIFWFTFFHEAGHIILHGKDQLIIDGGDLSGDQLEDEANTFAANFLIPPVKYRTFIMSYGQPDERVIRSFAEELQITPGIIVGRMQKEGRIPYTWHSKLKNRFTLEK